MTNTPWGERRRYEFEGRAGRPGKAMHVSPFQAMDHDYVLHATPPAERLTVHIENLRDGVRVFDATLSLERRPASCAGCGCACRPAAAGAGPDLRHAALLALRGARYHPHPCRAA